MTVPCGKCIGCRANQARDWSIRLQHEGRCHEASWFLTLTYNEENLPANGSLCPEDLQRFFKSLRKRFPPKAISYFACGEYGETTSRPHYHAVLYGPAFLDRRSLPRRDGHDIWRSPTVDDCWEMGIHELGTVTPASAAYVAGYVQKKVTAAANPFHYAKILDPMTGELLEVEREFTRMSRRPAIGKRWIERWWRDVYPADRVFLEGREYPPPRFYDKWMEEHHPDIIAEVKWNRDQEGEFTDDYTLSAKKACHEARMSLYDKRSKI